MRRTGLVLLTLTVWALTIYGGAAWGYLQGGPQYQAKYSASDAAVTVIVLRALREGAPQPELFTLLESMLDGQVIVHSTFDPELARFLDVFEMLHGSGDEADRDLMARVAAYRTEFPTDAGGLVRTTIENHLALYRE